MGLGINLNMDKGKQETGINTDIIEYKHKVQLQKKISILI